jgi:hypothetical protein
MIRLHNQQPTTFQAKVKTRSAICLLTSYYWSRVSGGFPVPDKSSTSWHNSSEIWICQQQLTPSHPPAIHSSITIIKQWTKSHVCLHFYYKSSRSRSPYPRKPPKSSNELLSSFFCKNVAAWNSLPPSLRHTPSVLSFKHRLKLIDMTSFLTGKSIMR